MAEASRGAEMRRYDGIAARVGVTRKNIRCCRPFPDSLLKQPNLMNSCRRESERKNRLLWHHLQQTRESDAPLGSSLPPTRPGTRRLSMPIRSFFSSRSFWKFSILTKPPWSCSTTSDTSARAAAVGDGGWGGKAEHEIFSETQRLNHTEVSNPTSAVPEVHVRGRVVFAQPLQDLLVVDEAVQGPQDEDVQRDVADLLQLKVPAQTLQPAGRPARLLQLQQHL